MLRPRLEDDIKKVIKKLGLESTDTVCTISPNPTFGDYTTNIALQQPKQKSNDAKHSPIEIAKDLVSKLQELEYVEKAEAVGPGFVNIFIKDEFLLKDLENFSQIPQTDKPQRLFVEYGHTNPLKEVHIGHLRTFILGETVARIFESQGHTIFRANYQGDIGLHIAKAIWGVQKLGLPTKELSLSEKAEFMGKAYAQGNQAYEDNPLAKEEINEINTKLYQKNPGLEEIYQLTRRWSLDYFQPIYQLLGIKYDRCFFESEVYARGKELVLANLGKVFEESEGAIIFPGEKYGLHSRVFITSGGNPTYEGKDMGLAEAEYEAFNYDRSIHVVAHEQAGYFEVIFKAMELIFPRLQGKKLHLSYGLVDLKEGKMSSRSGNVITVDDLVGVVLEKVREVMKGNGKEINQEVAKQVALGAIKFAYLKVSPTPNMVFDLEESVSLEGASGPYLQYSYVRTQSVLKKVKNIDTHLGGGGTALAVEERRLLVKLSHFASVVEAACEYRPNLLCEYLVELAREFNLFYQKYRILESEQVELRLALTKATGEVLKTGLGLLGIESPTKM